MPRPNPLTPSVQAAFLAELRRGTLVVAAAAKVGVALQTLYRRRGRDPGFGAAWSEAAEASFGWGWGRLPGGRWRRRWAGRPSARRLRFGGSRRAAYLEALGREGDRIRAARAVRVDPRTVRRAMSNDPDFARADEAALERGRARRARTAAIERTLAARRMIGIVERIAAALADPRTGHDRYICRRRRFWRPDWPEGWDGPGFRRIPAAAVPELERKIRRIELARTRRAVALKWSGRYPDLFSTPG